jgi:putative FmdB family regulatory protein
LPLYEYQCKKCHSLTERIQKFSDPPLVICPHCGGELEQLISAPAVQFKGSGWYVTDYAKGSSKGGGKSGNGSAESSSDGKGSDNKGSDNRASDSKTSESKSSDRNDSNKKTSSSASDKGSSGSEK